MIQVQGAHLCQKRITGIITVNQRTGLFHRLGKGKSGKIITQIFIAAPDLLPGQTGLISHQLVYGHFKKAGQLGQQQNIRRSLTVLPLGYRRLRHPQEIRQFLLGYFPLPPQTGYIVPQVENIRHHAIPST
jgi:hypothetical protein